MTMLRALIFFLLITLCGFSAHAQELPIQWEDFSRKTLVFKISDKEAEKLQKKMPAKDSDFEKYLHTPLTVFEGEWEDAPDRGHFLHANVVQNKIIFKYVPLMPYQVFMFREYGKLTLQVVDGAGNIRDDAKVRIKGRWPIFDNTVPYDKESKTYSLEDESEKEQRILTVELDKYRTSFNLSKNFVYPSWYGSSNYSERRPDFYSYMITDKNKYKPNDKIQFKSYALTGNKKPIKEDLELWMNNYSGYKKIADVSPYNPGGFAGDVQLHDSLELKLDRSYSIFLRDKKGRTVSSSYFKYEDYELNDNRLEVKLQSSTQYYPNANKLELKVVDANGLILPDMKAKIIVRRNQVLKAYKDVISLPDILIDETIDMSNVEATNFEIPHTLFGETDCSYSISIEAFSHDNQRMMYNGYATYYRSHYAINHRMVNDSIRFDFFNLGVNTPTKAKLWYNNIDSVKIVDLPHIEEFHQATPEYNLKMIDFDYSQNISQRYISSGLCLEGGFVKDSFNISLNNPLKLDVSWYIYEGGRLLQKGAGKEIDFKSYDVDYDITYYVEAFYFMGKEEHVLRRAYVPKTEYLSVGVDLPNRIYPGQTVDATIHVQDHRGKNVKGVDLTAFAYNSLLNNSVSDLPYYGKSPATRKQEVSYDIHKRTMGGRNMQLDYDKWKDYFALDSLPYYQFTYPKTMFKHTVNTPDSTTQFAPYVTYRGELIDLYAIQQESIPIYFSWTNQPKKYSFLVDPDSIVNLAVRLHDSAIIFDAMQFEKGKKTIFSVNLDSFPRIGSSAYLQSLDINAPKKDAILLEFSLGLGSVYRFSEREKSVFTQLTSILPTPRWGGVSYLKQDSVNHLIYHKCFNSGNKSITAGPIMGGRSSYMGGVKYRHEGGFRYEFEENVVYKHPANVIPSQLNFSSSTNISSVNDFALTPSVFDKIVDKCKKGQLWYPRSIVLSGVSNMNLTFILPEDKEKAGIFRFYFINKALDKQVVIDEGMTSTYYQEYAFEPGLHDLYVVYNDGKYLKTDSIPLHKDHYTFANIGNAELHEADEQSMRWLAEVPSAPESEVNTQSVVTNRIDNSYYTNSYSPATKLGLNAIEGVVKDAQGEPLIGASILVKGTTNGTMADLDGKFQINTPDFKSTLVIQYIGFTSKELEVEWGSSLSIVLEENNALLEEVVVVGYGTMKKRELTGAISSVSGDQLAGSAPNEILEGTDDSATEEDGEEQLYQELMQLSGLRSNFSDVGFWQPSLVTDKHGKAKFTATFPDNITQWQAVIYAMNRKLKTGTARKAIKSYKPIMAELKTPHFLVVGDSSYFAGNIRNYTKDKEIQGQIQFAIESDTLMNTAIQFANSHPDKLLVEAQETDSITATYLFTRNDGYSDGERRTIPIQLQGTELAKGDLRFLKNGQEETVVAGENEEVFVSLTGKQIDIYMEAARYLKSYKYDCNEQLASKLIGLLNLKLYKEFSEEKFKDDKEVNKIIKRLLANQNKDKLWSWWGASNSTSFWMSAHILKALHMARDAGYSVGLNISNIEQDYVHTQRYRYVSMYDIDILHALSSWGTTQNYEAAVKMFDNKIVKLEAYEDSVFNAWNAERPSRFYHKRSYMKEKLMLTEIRQQQNLGYDTKMLTQYQKKDILGGIYFDDGLWRPWYSDKDATTILAYRIMRNDSTINASLDEMQMYILGTRRNGWNTYQAASVVSTILPDLLAQSVTRGNTSSVKLSGKDNKTLTEFPYNTKLSAGESLKIEKLSGLPLIYSSYVVKRETKANSGEAFDVSSHLTTGYAPANELVAGKPVQLVVNVEVKQKNAEHILIEVPIPAGCSYNSKPNSSWYGREVHREYFKEKTVIFCETLPIGSYSFTIDLLPRYSGSYILNPAKVELMYFPVINANNDIRKVSILERKQ